MSREVGRIATGVTGKMDSHETTETVRFCDE